MKNVIIRAEGLSKEYLLGEVKVNALTASTGKAFLRDEEITAMSDSQLTDYRKKMWDLILCDEPTGALDYITGITVLKVGDVLILSPGNNITDGTKIKQ